MALDLNRIRSDFPALGESIYMNTGGTGPLSRQMVDSITGQYRGTVKVLYPFLSVLCDRLPFPANGRMP